MTLKTLYFFLVFNFIWYPSIQGQTAKNGFFKPSDTLNPGRKKGILISEAGVAGLSLIGLNQLWYSDFQRSSFRSINDGDEWMQVDKMGHVYSAYQITRLGAESLAWSGVDKREQLIFGTALSLGFLSTIEIFDGFSSEWGFSWYDFGANVLGSGLFIAQEIVWKEQRITPKFSFHRSDFARLNPSKLGDGFIEEFFKDYNGQTYWLSFNLRSFFKSETIPSWLNIAIGYGGEGMLTGIARDPDEIFVSQDRYVQYYLGLDLDLTRIKTESHLLKTVFSLFNTLKIPLPTLEFSRKKNLRFYLLY